MMLKAFCLSLLIILLSSSPCFGGFSSVALSSKNFHNMDISESPEAAPKASLLTNQQKLGSFPNFNLSSNGVFAQRRRRARSPYLINVNRFGARADGQTDDSQAFRNAWETACHSSRKSIFLVPQDKTYHIRRINFTGPCKSSMKMEIRGTIRAFSELYVDPKRFWIKFHNVRNFEVQGGGIIDGNGEIWWNNSCKIKKTPPCLSQVAPTAVIFNKCKNLKVSNLHIQNSQQMHLTFQECLVVKASNIKVTAPGKSPNTDGIHISRTRKIDITTSEIKTGDDCISIVNGSKNVRVTDIICGPGHGISIGSLGENHSEDQVSDVLVNGATISGTTNGVRIKTWQGGSGYARNIIFQNIEMRNVSNPIIIDQNYCDKNESCIEQNSAVQVMNVMYKNIQGTSASKVAIKFNCSETVPCRGLLLENVYLKRLGKGEAEAKCSNVIGLDSYGSSVFPNCPTFSN